VWKWDQGEPFGNDVPNNDPSGLGAFEFPLRFPGQYFDRETNLAYNLRRDYDPTIARYIESDPIGLRGGLNTYAYVNGSPLRRIDPFGLAGEDIFGGGRGGYSPVPGLPNPSGDARGRLAGQLTGLGGELGGILGGLVQKVKDFCSPKKSCNEHLKDCMESGLSWVTDGHQSRCVSCWERCNGSGTGTWPSSLENIGTCDYENFKLQ